MYGPYQCAFLAGCISTKFASFIPCYFLLKFLSGASAFWL
jgi:hypothetical protein